jgi:hypothetical protein
MESLAKELADEKEVTKAMTEALEKKERNMEKADAAMKRT